MSTFFRRLPSLTELLESPPLKQLIDTANRQTVVVSAKKFLSGLEAEVSQIARWIREGAPPRPLPIINATGDLLHPELSPPPLAKTTLAAMQIASAGYMPHSSEAGARQPDHAAVESLLCDLSGGEAALVVQSGSAALMLALTWAKAKGEVVVARGDLVQSPRGVRISDIADAASAKLREVGAANKTTLADYEHALSGAGAILSIRWSSAEKPSLTELAELGRRSNAAVIADLGGAPLDSLAEAGINAASVKDSAKSHVDLLLFSTDELLGGPAAGVLLGKRSVIEQLRQTPLYGVLAAQPITLSGLLGTLDLYKEPNKAKEEIPILSLLTTSLANLEFRALRVAAQLEGSPLLEKAEVVKSISPVGGQFDPSQVIPTYCINLLPKNSTASALASSLRSGCPAVLAAVRKDHLCIDLRTVFPDQDAQIVEAFEALAGASADRSPPDGGTPPTN
jgi:L-seryl-tRNA(Ser) seleniumtransferase